MKKLLVILIALAVAIPVYAAVQKATLINNSGNKVVVTAGSEEAQRYFGQGYSLMKSPYKTVCDIGEELEKFGGFYSPDIMGLQQKTKTINNGGTIYATTTLRLVDSGTTYLLSGTGTHITLPAVNRVGTWFRFVINGAAGIGNYIIDSAEGDNIEGSLIVAGAVVDCGAEDQINFVVDGENIGDFVEVISTGTYWAIGASGGLTSAKITCTDPS